MIPWEDFKSEYVKNLMKFHKEAHEYNIRIALGFSIHLYLIVAESLATALLRAL